MEESEMYITKAIMHSGGPLIYSYGGIKVSDKELKINTEELRQWKKKVQYIIQHMLICKFK